MDIRRPGIWAHSSVQISRVSGAVGKYGFPAQRTIGLGKPLRLRREKGGLTRFSRENLRPNRREEAPRLHFSFRETSDFKALYLREFPPAFGATTSLPGKRKPQLRTRPPARWRHPRGRGRDSGSATRCRSRRATAGPRSCPRKFAAPTVKVAVAPLSMTAPPPSRSEMIVLRSARSMLAPASTVVCGHYPEGMKGLRPPPRASRVGRKRRQRGR
jgi:hypothetical protein